MPPTSQLIGFTHIAKTAGTTLHHVLRRTFGTGYVVVKKRYASGPPMDAADLRRLQRRYRRLRAFGGHPVLPHGNLVETHPEIRFVTMVRDPVTRCASQYAHFVGNGGREPFFSWIRNERWYNHQTVRLAGVADADEAIRVLDQRFVFVGLVEKFDESLRLMRHHLPGLAVPTHAVRRNVSRSRDLRDQLLSASDALDAIAAIHQEDARLYDHVRTVIWPRQLAEAGSRQPPLPSELKATLREKLSLGKERLLFGLQRKLGRAPFRLGNPL